MNQVGLAMDTIAVFGDLNPSTGVPLPGDQRGNFAMAFDVLTGADPYALPLGTVDERLTAIFNQNRAIFNNANGVTTGTFVIGWFVAAAIPGVIANGTAIVGMGVEATAEFSAAHPVLTNLGIDGVNVVLSPTPAAPGTWAGVAYYGYKAYESVKRD